MLYATGLHGVRPFRICYRLWKKARGKDLIIDRADRMVHLCEMKFSVGPYELKDAYEKKLRQRMTIFREATKCTKALVNTFVTTFGVADGMHKSIVNSEVTLDELFR